MSPLPALIAAADAPATPGAQEAREAAEAELAKPAYHPVPNLLGRLWRWLVEHLDPTTAIPGIPPLLSGLIVLLVLVTCVVLFVVLLRRFRLVGHSRRAAQRLFDDERDARALARAADAAAERGDWDAAVVERFRAIIRSLDERGLIEDYPGMTAHEAAALASSALGALGGELTRAAVLFDAVRYGEVVSTAEQDAWMRDLARRVDAARIDRTGAAGAHSADADADAAAPAGRRA